MHILFIPAWLSVDKRNSQLGSFFIEQAEALRDSGVSVGFLYINQVTIKKLFQHIEIVKSNNSKYGVYEKNNIKYVIKPFFTFISKVNLLESFFYTNYFKNLEIYINKYGKPDIVHFHSMYGMGSFPKMLKEKYNIPIVITEHYSGYALKNVPKYEILKLKKNLEATNKFFAVSDFYKNKLNEVFNTDKIKIIPNNLSKDIELQFNNVEKNDVFTFIQVGNLVPVKNQKLGILAFKKFLEFNPNAILNIVGTGKEYKNLKKIVASLKLQKSVFFLGRLNRKETLMQIAKAHVLLVTSKVETFSVVTIEAFALKTLVVSTKCGGPEMLINKTNGIICDNSDLFYSGLIDIYVNYKKYELDRVRMDCIKKFCGKNISNILIREYSEIIDEISIEC